MSSRHKKRLTTCATAARAGRENVFVNSIKIRRSSAGKNSWIDNCHENRFSVKNRCFSVSSNRNVNYKGNSGKFISSSQSTKKSFSKNRVFVNSNYRHSSNSGKAEHVSFEKRRTDKVNVKKVSGKHLQEKKSIPYKSLNKCNYYNEQLTQLVQILQIIENFGKISNHVDEEILPECKKEHV